MIKNKKKLSICTVCGSKNLQILSKNEADPKKISFTYDFSPESRKTFQVIRCKSCSHVFCSPIPDNIYKNYEDVIDEKYLEYSKSRKLSYLEIIKIIKKIKRSGRILDVGCATGDFINVARKSGYDAYGLELSNWASRTARKNGIKVYEETLRTHTKKHQKKYDIITLWGVVEHLENPNQEFKYLNKLLKSNGILILWTGDVDSITSKILGRKWWYWQGQHIQYFTQASLNLLGSLNGFSHINTLRYPMAMSSEQMDNSLRRYKAKIILMLFIRPFFSFKKIWYLRIPGEMLWIGQKKD